MYVIVEVLSRILDSRDDKWFKAHQNNNLGKLLLYYSCSINGLECIYTCFVGVFKVISSVLVN